MRSNNRTIGITMGDPAGIGPEVVAKALRDPKVKNLARFKIIGDVRVLRRYRFQLPKNSEIIDISTLDHKHWRVGQANFASGQAALSYLDYAIRSLKNKRIHALVTAPVNKEAICLRHKNFVGHTEYLADAFKIKSVGMMFVADTMKTIIVTRHLPIVKIPNALTQRSILDTIALTDQALKKYFHIKRPTIGVCGLNPHAGEGGNIGKEEIQTIIPAIKKARAKGIQAKGPFAADTLFSLDLAKPYDAVVAMYHDQGLIPIKTLYLNKLVNLTVGLPFVRTSPAHGTALDIAGKNKANPSSMIEAIKLAARLS